MAGRNIQQNNSRNQSNQVWYAIPSSSTAQIHNQQPQQVPIHVNNITGTVTSQLPSLVSYGSSISTESTSPEVKEADELYDKIEDMISDYMREPHRHYLNCRVLRWAHEEDESRQFTAVVIINPSTTEN